MIGTISLNIIVDNTVINEYPVVMFFNGSDVTEELSGNKELIDYLTNVIHADTYMSARLCFVAYWTMDTSDTSDDNVTKDSIYINKLIPIDSVIEKIAKECIDTKASSLDDAISEKLQKGIAFSTVVNLVRAHAIEYRFNKEDISKIVSLVQTKAV